MFKALNGLNSFECKLFLLELCETQAYWKSAGTCACGLFLGDLSWFEGVARCSALGAGLPEVYSDDQNDVLNTVRPFTCLTNLYVGAH